LVRRTLALAFNTFFYKRIAKTALCKLCKWMPKNLFSFYWCPRPMPMFLRLANGRNERERVILRGLRIRLRNRSLGSLILHFPYRYTPHSLLIISLIAFYVLIISVSIFWQVSRNTESVTTTCLDFRFWFDYNIYEGRTVG